VNAAPVQSRKPARLSLQAVLGFLLPGLLGALPIARGAEQAGPYVAGFERFHQQADQAIAGGELLLGELNCVACHQVDAATLSAVGPKAAPNLDAVGARVKVGYLRQFIADPQHMKPGTTMPNLFNGVDRAARDEQVESLVHFLALTGAVSDTPPDRKAAAQGEALFQKVGCMACHAPRKGPGAALPSVPLGDLASKYSIASLSAFLLEPHKVRPSGRMPSLNLTSAEALGIASYFLQGVEVAPNLHFTSYSGDWQKVPDFSAIQPKQTGTAAGFDVRAAQTGSNFGLRFTGFLRIQRAGEYTFHLGSDDGSKLYLDETLVADCDGTHPFQFKSGKSKLTAGMHPLKVDYFQGNGEAELRLEIEGPGLARQPADGNLFLTAEEPKSPKRPEQAAFQLDLDQAEKGRELFVNLGCAACHQIKHKNELLVSKLAAPALKSLKPVGGCLSAAPAKGVADFRLNEPQRTALQAALSQERLALETMTPRQAIAKTMIKFNCVACHQRDGLGGVEIARNDFFQTTIKEMGDEGRLPPTLSGVGDKLHLEYLKQVLSAGGGDRPYMLTRMPKFGLDHVGHLPPLLATADIPAPQEVQKTEPPAARIKSEGRFLVGSKALACVKCHDFGQYPSSGIRAINLLRMPQRLRPDWFHRYMLDPQKFRPGTRMPAPWPDGKTFFRKVLDGSTDKQIDAVWAYLIDGSKAAVPAGVIGEPIELVPEKEPIIYRNFIEGAGPRAIAVGYPEKANLAFDAEYMRLALLWHGAFIDASRHWNGRGNGFQGPLGDDVMTLPPGAPLAVLTKADTVWPTTAAKEQGYRFKGYRLDKQRRPTFLYEMPEIQVEDEFVPVPGEAAGFRRRLSLKASAPVENLYFRVAAAGKIEELPGGWYSIDGQLKVRLSSGEKTLQLTERKIGNRNELLLKISFSGNEAAVQQEYAW